MKPYGDDVVIKKDECVGHVQKIVGKRLRAVRTVNIFRTINIIILRQNYNLGTVQGEDRRKEEGGRAEDEGGAGEVLSRYFQGPRPGSRQGEGARLPHVELLRAWLLLAEDEIVKTPSKKNPSNTFRYL